VPTPGDYPYGIRRNPRTGDLWITGSGSDSLYRLDPKTRRFTVYRLPRQGAYTRTVSFAENGDVWTNYASYPNAHTQAPYNAGVAVRLRPK
jgi:streptogramin lyase